MSKAKTRGCGIRERERHLLRGDLHEGDQVVGEVRKDGRKQLQMMGVVHQSSDKLEYGK